MPIIKEERFTGIPTAFQDVRADIKSSAKEDLLIKKVDDAKKSAIKFSRDYDEFRGLVDTCHLTPIHRSEFNAPAKLGSRNASFNGKLQAGSDPTALRALNTSVLSAADFYGQFKRVDKEKRLSFIYSLGYDQFNDMFCKDMDVGLFGDIVESIVLFTSDPSGREVCRWIYKMKWFNYSWNFLTKSEQEALLALNENI